MFSTNLGGHGTAQKRDATRGSPQLPSYAPPANAVAPASVSPFPKAAATDAFQPRGKSGPAGNRSATVPASRPSPMEAPRGQGGLRKAAAPRYAAPNNLTRMPAAKMPRVSSFEDFENKFF